MKKFIVRVNCFMAADERKSIEEKIKNDLIKQGFTVVGPECEVYIVDEDRREEK